MQKADFVMKKKVLIDLEQKEMDKILHQCN